MTIFATDFPVKRKGSNEFLAQLVGWLRGINDSRVLDQVKESELGQEAAVLKSTNGEELRVMEFRPSGTVRAVGFRHDLPDNEGRVWRTEAVLIVEDAAVASGQNRVRLRTQCIAREAGAVIEMARKPYLIKAIIKDGWGGLDGLLGVSDEPVWLKPVENDFFLAQAAHVGDASNDLPILYISSDANSQLIFSEKQIEKLAFDLGGVAHVLVEPSREFSLELKRLTSGRNVYGGAIGLLLPSHGVWQRFFPAWAKQDRREMLRDLTSWVVSFRSQMPSHGWDWIELQEETLRLQRERDRKRLTPKENELLYQQEIEMLKERVLELQSSVASRGQLRVTPYSDGLFSTDQLLSEFGPEIYPGEFSDRMRLAARLSLSAAETSGLDDRSTEFFRFLSEHVPPSVGLGELRDDLKRASRDEKRAGTEFCSVLCAHGYVYKSDNRHVRLEPAVEFKGLASVTLAKTPSDLRSAENTRSQIERSLGITKLWK